MLLIWIGGGLLLYIDLEYPIRIVVEYWKNKTQPEDFDVLTWVQMFARPLFVFGVMCAVAMPKLRGKKKGGKKKVENKKGDTKAQKPST